MRFIIFIGVLCFNLISNPVSARDAGLTPMADMPCENHQTLSNSDLDSDMNMNCCGDECACECSLLQHSSSSYFLYIDGYQFFSVDSHIDIFSVNEATGFQLLPISPPPKNLL